MAIPKGKQAQMASIMAEIMGLITERSLDFGFGPSAIRQQAILVIQAREDEYQHTKKLKEERAKKE